jgi:LuxR family maltose regulon positive regulatory protein
LTNLPPNAHAVLATRRDLRLRLHQLRLAGELAEIRAEDLRFTERETCELLGASGITLSEVGAALLHQRTEGWAAGVRLAAISLAGHPDPERFVAEFSGSERIVAEYLVAEMLERQPEDVQQVLLRTSLLDRVNGELADLLTGRPGSERILLSLEDANAFVVSLDPERTWFRYHHLFGDLLRLELRRMLPEQVPVLHRRAAEWFVQHGQAADAIRHTQEAGDWPDAARLLADHSFSLTMDGQAQTVRALLRAFPPGADYPELALIRAGRTLARGRLDQAAAHLAVAEAHAETTPPDRQRRLRVAIASLKLSLAAARSPGWRHRTGQIPRLPGNRAVRRGHRAQQRPAGSGADEPRDRRSVPGACRRRTPPSGGCRPGREDRPALPRSQMPRAARVRVEDPTVRHCPAALPGGDRARRAIRLGRGAYDRARADHAGQHDGVDG